MNPKAPIPLAAPRLDGEEWRYLRACLESGWVSGSGELVGEFERRVAARVGVGHAVATASGTAAIHLALLALGLGPGDEVVVPALTFAGTVNPVLYAGARPVFVDVEASSLGLDPGRLAGFLEGETAPLEEGRGALNLRTGGVVRGVVVVHLYGHPAPLGPIREVARRFGLWVVEDAAEALGARYEGRPAGGLGEVGCLSFNGNKIITAGGGGMVLTDDERLAERARYLGNQARYDAREYVHGEVGYNYRLSALQAAVGLAQLERLGEFVEAKRRIAGAYAERLEGCPGLELPAEAAWAFSNWWLYYVLVGEAHAGPRRLDLLEGLRRRGIEARSFFYPLPCQALYRAYQDTGSEVAWRCYERGVNLPSSVGLTGEELDRVCEALLAELSGERLHFAKRGGSRNGN